MEIVAKREDKKVWTGEVRLSYAHLFEPHGMDGQEPKYSVSLIIPKSDTETLKAIKEATDLAKKEGAVKWGGKIPANIKTPLRDGDTERSDDPNYADSYFLNANSKIKPQVVDKYRKSITDSAEVYSGCYGRATLNFYPYAVSGNKGIACGLGNVQKLREGDPLGGFARAEDDFEAVESDSEDFLG